MRRIAPRLRAAPRAQDAHAGNDWRLIRAIARRTRHGVAVFVDHAQVRGIARPRLALAFRWRHRAIVDGGQRFRIAAARHVRAGGLHTDARALPGGVFFRHQARHRHFDKIRVAEIIVAV